MYQTVGTLIGGLLGGWMLEYWPRFSYQVPLSAGIASQQPAVVGSQLLPAASCCEQPTVASSQPLPAPVATSQVLPAAAADARGLLARLTRPPPPRQMAADEAAAAGAAEEKAEEVDILAGMGLSAEEAAAAAEKVHVTFSARSDRSALIFV
jgi:hypothetical protein